MGLWWQFSSCGLDFYIAVNLQWLFKNECRNSSSPFGLQPFLFDLTLCGFKWTIVFIYDLLIISSIELSYHFNFGEPMVTYYIFFLCFIWRTNAGNLCTLKGLAFFLKILKNILFDYQYTSWLVFLSNSPSSCLPKFLHPTQGHKNNTHQAVRNILF